jgi:hypothetical protein
MEFLKIVVVMVELAMVDNSKVPDMVTVSPVLEVLTGWGGGQIKKVLICIPPLGGSYNLLILGIDRMVFL